MLRRGLVALPALRDFDVMAVIKADKLERLEAWIHVRPWLPDDKHMLPHPINSGPHTQHQATVMRPNSPGRS